MSDELQEIIDKCEQYWNESAGDGLGWPEVHAILEFIHLRATAVQAERERRPMSDQLKQAIKDGIAESFNLSSRGAMVSGLECRHAVAFDEAVRKEPSDA